MPVGGQFDPLAEKAGQAFENLRSQAHGNNRNVGVMKNVSATAGHSRPDTTLWVYTHASTAAAEAIVSLLNEG